ncbi:MAG: hypothetical protein HY726_11250 [Candidatus Rokubacteria bacterium]|nr:hypothetical protein [Candidatus Rokubacteria bacterium]
MAGALSPSNQWRVAAKDPPHLAAIIPWEGYNDRYRDNGYHGGILSQFQERWAKIQVVNVQYGRGERARKNPNTGESVAGPVTLPDEGLAKNRVNIYEALKKHPLDDAAPSSSSAATKSEQSRTRPRRSKRSARAGAMSSS